MFAAEAAIAAANPKATDKEDQPNWEPFHSISLATTRKIWRNQIHSYAIEAVGQQIVGTHTRNQP